MPKMSLKVSLKIPKCPWKYIVGVPDFIGQGLAAMLLPPVKIFLRQFGITASKLWVKSDKFCCYRWMGDGLNSPSLLGWVGLWGFLWWAPSAKGKDHHGVSSGWSSVWHRSNTGLSSTQYEQIPITLGVWSFWLTPFFFRSITFWRAYG